MHKQTYLSNLYFREVTTAPQPSVVTLCKRWLCLHSYFFRFLGKLTNQAFHLGVALNQIALSSTEVHPLAPSLLFSWKPKEAYRDCWWRSLGVWDILNFPKDEEFSHGEKEQKEILFIKSRVQFSLLSLTELVCMQFLKLCCFASWFYS